ncbi:hypothetical protein F441_08982, partial [Phytophthora nicotianae CJ01A1]
MAMSRYGAYTMDALQKGLQRRQKQLIYLNTKAGFKSRPKRPEAIFGAADLHYWLSDGGLAKAQARGIVFPVLGWAT